VSGLWQVLRTALLADGDVAFGAANCTHPSKVAVDSARRSVACSLGQSLASAEQRPGWAAQNSRLCRGRPVAQARKARVSGGNAGDQPKAYDAKSQQRQCNAGQGAQHRPSASPLHPRLADTKRLPFHAHLEASFITEKAPCAPHAVWTWDQASGGKFANINRPVAGSTHDKVLPVGKHPLQLYSLVTPSGVKVTVMLEELLALSHSGAEYDAWLIKINEGDQFSSGFVDVNPNSKIPALLDRSTEPPTRVFESGAILLYMAEKFGAFLPKALVQRTEALNWLFWQMGSAPYLGGGFGHFDAYAPEKFEYPINRFAMEIKRQLNVLERNLAERPYMAGDEYTVADIAIYPGTAPW